MTVATIIKLFRRALPKLNEWGLGKAVTNGLESQLEDAAAELSWSGESGYLFQVLQGRDIAGQPYLIAIVGVGAGPNAEEAFALAPLETLRVSDRPDPNASVFIWFDAKSGSLRKSVSYEATIQKAMEIRGDRSLFKGMQERQYVKVSIGSIRHLEEIKLESEQRAIVTDVKASLSRSQKALDEARASLALELDNQSKLSNHLRSLEILGAAISITITINQLKADFPDLRLENVKNPQALYKEVSEYSRVVDDRVYSVRRTIEFEESNTAKEGMRLWPVLKRNNAPLRVLRITGDGT